MYQNYKFQLRGWTDLDKRNESLKKFAHNLIDKTGQILKES